MRDNDNKDKVKFEWKDILALIIAQFEILFPLAVISIAGMSVLLFAIMRIWL